MHELDMEAAIAFPLGVILGLLTGIFASRLATSLQRRLHPEDEDDPIVTRLFFRFVGFGGVVMAVVIFLAMLGDHSSGA